MTFRANALARTGRYEEALPDYRAAERLFLQFRDGERALDARANAALALYQVRSLSLSFWFSLLVPPFACSCPSRSHSASLSLFLSRGFSVSLSLCFSLTTTSCRRCVSFSGLGHADGR